MKVKSPESNGSPLGGTRVRKGIWAFAGGKGGVGRSLLAANFAVQLARTRRSVTLLDLDLDNPTLHAFLGYPSRDPGISLLFEHDSTRLTDCLKRVSYGELYFAKGVEGPVGPLNGLPSRLIEGIESLGTDFVILDLGSSRSSFSLDLFRKADVGIVILTPDPLSLQGAYTFLNQLRPSNGSFSLGPGNPADGPANGNGSPPIGPEGETIGTSLSILVNQVRNEEDAFLGRALRSGLWRVLGFPATDLGTIPHEPAVMQAMEKGRPLSLQYPNSNGARSIASLLKDLRAFPPSSGWKAADAGQELQNQGFYDILEITRETSHRQIQKAYETLRRIYRPNSPYLPASLTPENLQRITDRIDQAYRTLIFLETRRDYDRRITSTEKGPSLRGGKPGPGTPAMSQSSGEVQETAGEDLPPIPESYTGETLRRIREERSISLDSIADITKIRKVHLDCIEHDNFSFLPAPVFLKGFLRAYAQCLALNPEEVCKDYMDLYQQWTISRQESPPALVDEEI